MVKGANISNGNDLLVLMLNATIEETTIKGGKVHFGIEDPIIPLYCGIKNMKPFFSTTT